MQNIFFVSYMSLILHILDKTYFWLIFITSDNAHFRGFYPTEYLQPIRAFIMSHVKSSPKNADMDLKIHRNCCVNIFYENWDRLINGQTTNDTIKMG